MADIDLRGTQKNITIVQGNTSRIDFELRNPDGTPLDMTGYTLRMHVRPAYGSAQVWIEATVDAGFIWTNQAQGQWKLLLLPSHTESIRFPADTPDQIDGVYDMEVVAPAAEPGTQKPWYGTFSIVREASLNA